MLARQDFWYTDFETEETINFKGFGFDLWAIQLGHPAFDQFDQEPMISLKQLNTAFRIRQLLKEMSQVALVVFFTGKQLAGGYDGFKIGAICQVQHNFVAVSFYGYSGEAPSYQVQRTVIEELLHSIGVQHNSDTDNDVMNRFNSTQMVCVF